MGSFSVFEICMLLCFGASWPVSIYKSWTSRTAKGKSFLFMCFLFVGYIFGILHKIFYHPDFVIALYALNLLLISTDACLYFKNKKSDAEREGI
ncbi:MAG: hypothetical protein FWG32_02050 [Oscillospiraceae bacterium]|nr:hypothetical protein [Oscillospiraceae bacterium]